VALMEKMRTWQQQGMGRKYPNMDKGTEGQWLLTVTTPKEGRDPEDIEK